MPFIPRPAEFVFDVEVDGKQLVLKDVSHALAAVFEPPPEKLEVVESHTLDGVDLPIHPWQLRIDNEAQVTLTFCRDKFDEGVKADENYLTASLPKEDLHKLVSDVLEADCPRSRYRALTRASAELGRYAARPYLRFMSAVLKQERINLVIKGNAKDTGNRPIKTTLELQARTKLRTVEHCA